MTCRWLSLGENEKSPSIPSSDPGDEPGGDLVDEGLDELDQEVEVAESAIGEDLSSGEQKWYWAREQRWLREALRTLDVEEQVSRQAVLDNRVSSLSQGVKRGGGQKVILHEKKSSRG